MGYISAKFPEAPAVRGIYTVFRRDLGDSKLVSKVDVHDFPEIIYVRSGQLFLLVDGGEYILSSGQAMVYAPGSPHTSFKKTKSAVSIVSFDVDSASLTSLYNRPITLTAEEEKMLESVIDDGYLCFTQRPYFEDEQGVILREDADEYLVQRMKKGLELFLVNLLRKGEKTRVCQSGLSEYGQVLRFLRKNVYQTLTVARVASECKISISKLKYLFRENYGGGVINCFIEMKIEEAKKLIREGKYNFTEIADRLAFNSLHYFSRAFKKKVGISPSEYSKKFN